MWVWMVTAPTWVRWLVTSMIVAPFAGLIAVLTQPRLGAALGWPLGLPILALFSLIVGALVAALQQPRTQQYAEALQGLDTKQRRAAARALRRGDAPSDPAVVAAALHAGAIAMAVNARHHRRQHVAGAALPLLYIALTVLAYLDGDRRKAALWIGVAMLLAGLAARNAYNARRLRRQMTVLQSANPADLPPSAPTDVQYPSRWSRRRTVLTIALVTVVMGFALGAALGLSQPHNDCATADAIVSFVAQHNDLLDVQSVEAGGPDLTDYQKWSRRISELASNISDSGLARHAHRVAAHAQQVRDVAATMRSPEASDPTSDSRDGGALLAAAHGIVEKQNAMLAVCHPG
jgi:hypothetical protein